MYLQEKQKNFKKRLISSTGQFIDWKLQTGLADNPSVYHVSATCHVVSINLRRKRKENQNEHLKKLKARNDNNKEKLIGNGRS